MLIQKAAYLHLMILRLFLSVAILQLAMLSSFGMHIFERDDNSTNEQNVFWTSEKKKIMADALNILADMELPRFCNILESTTDAQFYTRKEMIDYVLAAVVADSNKIAHGDYGESDSYEGVLENLQHENVDDMDVPNGNIGAMVEISNIPQSRANSGPILKSESLRMGEDGKILPYGGVSYGESGKNIHNAVSEDEKHTSAEDVSFKAFNDLNVSSPNVLLSNADKIAHEKRNDVTTLTFEASVTDFAAQSGDGESLTEEKEDLIMSDPTSISNLKSVTTSDITGLSVNESNIDALHAANKSQNYIVNEEPEDIQSSKQVSPQNTIDQRTSVTSTVSTKESTSSTKTAPTVTVSPKLKMESKIITYAPTNKRVTFDNSDQKQKSQRTISSNINTIPEMKSDVNAEIRESITEASKEILDVSDFGPTAVKGEIISGHVNGDGHVTSDGALPNINSELVKHPEGDLFQLDFFKSFFADMFTKPKTADKTTNKIQPNTTVNKVTTTPSTATTRNKSRSDSHSYKITPTKLTDDKNPKNKDKTTKTRYHTNVTKHKTFKTTTGNTTSPFHHLTNNFSATFLPETKQINSSTEMGIVINSGKAGTKMSAKPNKNVNQSNKRLIPSSELKSSHLSSKTSRTPAINTAPNTHSVVRNDEPVSYWDLFQRQQEKSSTTKQPKTLGTKRTKPTMRLQLKTIPDGDRDRPNTIRGIIPDKSIFSRPKSRITKYTSGVRSTVSSNKSVTTSPQRMSTRTENRRTSPTSVMTSRHKTTERRTRPTTKPVRVSTSKAATDSKRRNYVRQEDEAAIGVDFICPSVFGFYSDDTDCKGFYICSWGFANRFSCPKGTAWNLRLNVCDWQSKVRCYARPMYEDYGYEEELR